MHMERNRLGSRRQLAEISLPVAGRTETHLNAVFKSEDVIRVSGIQILCCAESIFSPDESKNTVVSDEITEEQRIMLYDFSVSCELTELDSIRATWIYQTKSS